MGSAVRELGGSILPWLVQASTEAIERMQVRPAGVPMRPGQRYRESCLLQALLATCYRLRSSFPTHLRPLARRATTLASRPQPKAMGKTILAFVSALSAGLATGSLAVQRLCARLLGEVLPLIDPSTVSLTDEGQ